MKTVVGLFDTYAHAEIAAHDLERTGISHDHISLLTNNTTAQVDPMDAAPTHPTYHAETETEAGKGAVAGGVAGLLLGLAALAIPGLGVVAAVGWLTTTVAGAVVGAGVGIVGALNGVGVPHEDAVHYNEGVRRGGTLLAVRAEDSQAAQVAQILSADGAVDIDERAEQYRQEGFVPPAPHLLATPPVAPPAPVDATAVTDLRGVEPEAEQVGARVNHPTAELPVQEVVLVEEPVEAELVEVELVEVEPRPSDLPTSKTGLLATTRDLKPQTTRRAYELYEQRGHRDGHALDDWLDAERELQSNAVGRTNAEATPV